MTVVAAPERTGLVRTLAAPTSTWDHTADVVVVGSGVAGLGLAHALSGSGLRVAVVTKGRLGEGSTTWAQGGVASAIGVDDSPEQHLRDTLVAGAGLCDEDAVRTLVTEGPEAVREILAAGARFDVDGDGRLAFAREGGHSRARVVHAGGDATGLEIQRALEAAVDGAGEATLFERAFALDLLRDADGAAAGVSVATVDAHGRCVNTGTVRARAVVLATGGLGQVYASTTNPDVSTGDGVALALRGGAEVADLEFVQFHPTVFWRGAGARGRQLLVSEAVRGEGATLIDATGASVMSGVHPLGDLAPRDVVAFAMAERMAAVPGGIFLDARQIGEAALLRRFPTIVAGCRAAGVDPVVDLVPVAPAAHYSCGGVRADMTGHTSLSGLYALGEVACTGVHGANRLASNSLLEGLVVARRLARSLTGSLPPLHTPEPGVAGQVVDATLRGELAAAMSRDVAVRRTPEGLRAAAALAGSMPLSAEPGLAAWETTNLHTIATVLLASALRRTESRGCHRRTDAEEPREEWHRHIVSTMDGTEVR